MTRNAVSYELKRIWPLYLIITIYMLYLFANIIQEDILKIPILVLPENGDKLPNDKIALIWNEMKYENISYEVQISETRNFKNLTYYQSSPIYAYYPGIALDINKKYFWRVRSVINDKKSYWSYPHYFYTVEIKYLTN